MEAARPLPRSRRRVARDLACGLSLCLALTGLVLVALPLASGDAAGVSAVVISGPGAVRYELAGGELEGAAGTEAGPYSYTVRAHPGEPGETFARTGAPLAKLIELSGTQVESIGYVVMSRSDGTSSYLPATDLTESPPEGQGPPLVSADSECIRFVRPLFGPDDANAEDNLASCGAPLTIAVRDGRILSVSASATATTPEAGATVGFNAATEGQEEGEAVSYRWSFGDGTSAEGPTPSHDFAAAGSYRVTVAATGSEESGGESAPLTIVVGSAPAAGTGAGTEPTKAPLRHSSRGVGKSGAGSGKGSGSGGKAGGSGRDAAAPVGTGGKGGAENSGASSGSSSTPATVAPEAAFASPEPPAPFVPESESAPLPAPPAESKPPAPASPDPGEEATPGRTVQGRLVSDFLVAGAAGESSADSGSESSAAAPVGGSGSVPLTGILAAALLASGVAFEWRRQARGRGR